MKKKDAEGSKERPIWKEGRKEGRKRKLWMEGRERKDCKEGYGRRGLSNGQEGKKERRK